MESTHEEIFESTFFLLLEKEGNGENAVKTVNA